MSFFSDLFKGDFSNLWTDVAHAPSSLINNPTQLAETLGGVALVAAPFLAPAIGGALGIGAADAAAGGSLAELGAGDIGAAAAADAAAGGGGLASALGLGDIGTAAALDAASTAAPLISSDALAFMTPADALSLSPAGSFGSVLDVTGGDVASTAPPDLSSTLPGEIDTSGGAAAQQATAPTTATAAIPAGTAADTATAAPAAATPAGSTTPAAAAAPTTGGGITSALGSTLNSPWTRLALGAAPLALALARGEPSLPAQATQAQAAASDTLAFGQQQLAAGQAGQLNPGQQATINAMRQDLTNQWRQVLFNQGVQNPEKDTRWPQIQALIDQQVTQQTATMIQQTIANGLQATGQASGTLTQIANMQMTSDQNFTNTLVNATSALGRAVGGGSTITLKAA